MNLAYSIGFSATADRMVWPLFLSRDRKWPHVTKCTHSRPVGLRLEGKLVNNRRASTTPRQNVSLRHYTCRLISPVMALTFDLWPGKHFWQRHEYLGQDPSTKYGDIESSEKVLTDGLPTGQSVGITCPLLLLGRH